jgi:hypothetical protein
MLLNTLLLLADTETLLLSSEENEFVGQVIDDVVTVLVEFLDVELLNAVMSFELASSVLFVANLAHDLDLRAISLEVVKQLGSCHMLELLSVADVTAKLGALILGVRLELSKSFPDDLTSHVASSPTSVGELTEVDAVSEDLVDLLHEVSPSLAVGAADVKLWSGVHLIKLLLAALASTSCVEFVGSSVADDVALSIHELLVGLNKAFWVSSLLEVNLAVFAEKLVAALALQRLERELLAHHALDFLHHFSLKLVLNGVHLDVQRGDRLWAHELFNGLVSRNEIESLIDGETILLAVHLLENRLESSVRINKLLDRHNIFEYL